MTIILGCIIYLAVSYAVGYFMFRYCETLLDFAMWLASPVTVPWVSLTYVRFGLIKLLGGSP